VKDRVAVEVQFGKHPFVAYDLNLIREGRGVPAVPLVLIGVAL